jgi:rod shape-determining protein MreD
MTLKSIVSQTITILFFVLFETAILTNIQNLPAIPDLLLISVLYFSVCNGSLSGEITGFLSGIVLDTLSAAPLGLNALLRTLLGYFAGKFHRVLNIEGFFVRALLGFMATLFKAVIIWLIHFFYPQGTILVYNLLSIPFLVELAMNTLLTPIMFSFLSIFSAFLIARTENTAS